MGSSKSVGSRVTSACEPDPGPEFCIPRPKLLILNRAKTLTARLHTSAPAPNRTGDPPQRRTGCSRNEGDAHNLQECGCAVRCRYVGCDPVLVHVGPHSGWTSGTLCIKCPGRPSISRVTLGNQNAQSHQHPPPQDLSQRDSRNTNTETWWVTTRTCGRDHLLHS